MKQIGYYTASEYVALRAGCLHSSYRTADGRYIVSDNDVRNALPQMTPEEYVNGFDLIPITEEEAKVLVKEGGYQIGPLATEEEPQGTVEESPEEQEEQNEETPNTEEE